MTSPRAFGPQGTALVFWRQAAAPSVVLTQSQKWKLFGPFAASAIVWGGADRNVVLTSVSKDLAASYAVIAPVQSDFAASYTVIGVVSKDLAASYAVQGAVSKDLGAVGRADEADTAYALSPLLLLTAGLSLEIDTAFARPALQARLVGRADELDQAAVPGGTFGLAHVISPRLWAVPSEDRTYIVPSEDRTYIVPSEDRGTAP